MFTKNLKPFVDLSQSQLIVEGLATLFYLVSKINLLTTNKTEVCIYLCILAYLFQVQRYYKQNTLHLHAMLTAPSCHPRRGVPDAPPPINWGWGWGETRPRNRVT